MPWYLFKFYCCFPLQVSFQCLFPVLAPGQELACADSPSIATASPFTLSSTRPSLSESCPPYQEGNLQHGFVFHKFCPQPCTWERKWGGTVASIRASVDRTSCLQDSANPVTLLFNPSCREGKRAHCNGTMGNCNKSITDTPSAFVKIWPNSFQVKKVPWRGIYYRI